MHAYAHNQWGKTGLGPQSERAWQNQLAFKLMKRVMKRALSRLERAHRRAACVALIVNLYQEAADTVKGTSKIFR